MKAARTKNLPGVLTLTGDALESLENYLTEGWTLVCYSWGYAFIVKGGN